MTAKNGCDDSREFESDEERSVDLAKMSLEQLLYYVLVQLRGIEPEAAVA
jgi:hypothetical protein